MSNKVEAMTVDPKAELSTALRTYKKLVPQCSMEKRVADIPQLAPQKKQMSILTNEMDDTLICLDLAENGRHAIREANTKHRIRKSIVQYENLETKLRDERRQQAELDCLNYHAQKNIIDLFHVIPTEENELDRLKNANKRLHRMENRLGLATKKLCVINADNRHVREEINRLLVERESFNTQWRRTINNLVKGKEYLIDILDLATQAFEDVDECCKKLDTLKLKGLFQLNKDIADMQYYNGELNHMAKLEEFLRMKSTTRILCKVEEKEAEKRELEIAQREQQIAKYHALLKEIFKFSGSESVAYMRTRFQSVEINNISVFILLCEVQQSSICLRIELEMIHHNILDYINRKELREEKQNKKLAELTEQLENQQKRTLEMLERKPADEEALNKVLLGINELISMVMCDTTPLMPLLGSNNEVTKWNLLKFVSILECEVKALIQVAYEIFKTPPPTPVTTKADKPVTTPRTTTKLIADPHVEPLRPNDIDDLVPYLPCAYCVEDYIMQHHETPVVLADEQFIQNIFHVKDVNTKFGIFTLTVPTKCHTLRNRSEV